MIWVTSEQTNVPSFHRLDVPRLYLLLIVVLDAIIGLVYEGTCFSFAGREYECLEQEFAEMLDAISHLALIQALRYIDQGWPL